MIETDERSESKVENKKDNVRKIMSFDILYYPPPSNKIFHKLKKEAKYIWNTMDNTYGYVDEKISRIKDLKNVQGNFMIMVAMFDPINQFSLSIGLDKKTREEVSLRLKSGGTPDEYNYFDYDRPE